MSFDVFLQSFDASETNGIPLEQFIAVFEGRLSKSKSKSKYGDYVARYGRGMDYADIYVTMSEADSQLVLGATVNRPVRDIRLWNSLFEILRLAPMCLYYPGDGPPLVARPALVRRKSPIFAALGRPKVVTCGEEIRSAIEDD